MRRTITFQEFWDAYGLKRDRVAAERSWRWLSAKDQHAAFRGIADYRADCEHRGISMMYAQGYLNHRRWEDEIVPVQQAKPGYRPRQAAKQNDTVIKVTDQSYDNMETW